jgi:hypothetical protein
MDFNVFRLMPPAARGALFEKTAPLDPPQKLFIKGSLCTFAAVSI